jgi:hypothetical protein
VGAGLVERRVGGARVDGRRGLFSNDVRHGGDALGGRERERAVTAVGAVCLGATVRGMAVRCGEPPQSIDVGW